MPVATARRYIPIEIVTGLGGQNASPNPANIPLTDLVRATNVFLGEDTVQKEGGAVTLGSVSAPVKIVGLHDFYDGSFTKFLVAALSDGRIVTLASGAISETLVSLSSSDRQTVFIEIINGTSKRLACFTGRDQVRVTRGTAATTAVIATPPTDWAGSDNNVNQPTAGCQHRFRLFAWGNENDPHRLYYSTTTNHEDFTGAGSGTIPVFPGEGERIAAAISFLGRLWIFKFPFGIYWLDEGAIDVAASNWVVRRLTRNVGMAGPLGLAVVEGDVFFVGTDGLIHALSGVREFGDARDSVVLFEQSASFLRDHITGSRLSRAIVTYYGLRKQCQIALSEGPVNNRRAIIDLHRPGQPMFHWSDRDVCEAMTTRRDANGVYRLIVGDDVGQVWELDQVLRNKNGQAYTGEFWTKNIPVMGGLHRGNLLFLDVVVTLGPGPTKLTVQVELDGKVTQTLAYTLGGGVLILDSGVLDTALLGGEPDETRTLRRRVTGDARYVRFRCANTGLDENFSVSKLVLWIAPGNARP